MLVAVVLVATSASSLWLGSRIKSPDQAIADAAPPPASLITTQVTERQLIQEIVVRGRVTVRAIDIVGRPSLGSTLGIVTDIRSGLGDLATSGDVPVVVDGRPIILLEGELPSYRDLTPGLVGSDVEQLQLALGNLGYEGETPDEPGTFGPATQELVGRMYTDLGFEPAYTSPDALEIVSASKRALDDAESGLALARLDRSAAATPADRTRAEIAVEQAQRGLEAAREAALAAELRNGIMVPAEEVVYIPTAQAVVVGLNAQLGMPVPDDGILASLGIGDPYVEFELSETQRASVDVDMVAQVTDPLSGEVFAGRVTRVSHVPAAESVPGGYLATLLTEPGIPSDRIGSEARVALITAQTSAEVLAVPISAVAASADGTASVSVVREGVPVPVGVDVGLSADGYVEITPIEPGSVVPGDLVALGYQTVAG